MKRLLFFTAHLIWIPLVALLYALPVLPLWNWLMPELFALPAINFWQAWGLVLLSHLLFRSGRRGGPGRRHGRWNRRRRKIFGERHAT